MTEGSGNGESLINLIWAPFFWIQIMLGAKSVGNLELQ